MGKVTHGHCRTPTYNCWANMIGRCTNQKRPDFKNYGGRGIKVCSRWETFANFLADMGERQDGMSLDRIDVNGDYCQENCRWVPLPEQNHNRRDTLWVVLAGEAMSATHAAKHLSIPYERIRWAVEKYGDNWIVYAASPTAGVIQSNNTSGHPGVSLHKASGRFHARIEHNGVRRSLGYYKTFEEAVAARVRAAAEIAKAGGGV